MKKILTLVLSMMFVMGLMIAPVSAAAGDVAIDASDVTAKPGETVTLTFSVSADQAVKFATYAFSFKYNPADLTYVADSATGAIFNPAYSTNTAFATQSTGADATYQNGDVLVTAQFVVKSDAKPNDVYPIEMAIDNVRTASGDYLTAVAYDGSVTILCPGCDGNWDNGTVTLKPTCTDEGIMTYTCKLCGATKTEPIAALGHKWDAGKVAKAPTCTETGIMTYTCKNDPNHTKDEVIAALGHDYEEKVTKPATCTEAGVLTLTCKNDPSHIITKTIPALGHKWDEGKVTTKPTCTENGVMTYTCLNDPSHTYTEVIPAHGHDWSDWEPLKKPTETEWGLDQRTCRICGCTETRDVAPAKDQVPDTGVRSNNYAAWIAVAAVAGVAVVTVARKRKTAK